jgi:hypothetical protein
VKSATVAPMAVALLASKAPAGGAAAPSASAQSSVAAKSFLINTDESSFR